MKKGESKFLASMATRKDIRIIGKYQGGLIPIEIICTNCNKQLPMLPKVLLRGSGCKSCRLKQLGKIKRVQTVNTLLQQAQKLDTEGYWDLSEFTYIKNTVSGIIKCRLCGYHNIRTLYNHVNKFAPCRFKCGHTKTKDYNLPQLPMESLSSNLYTTETQAHDEAEEWKTIANTSDTYECSSYGRFRNKVRGKFINGCLDNNTGYRRVTLHGKIRGAHQWIAETFLPNPQQKRTVNHRDKNRTNNHVSNLEWATHAEQNDHKNQEKKSFNVRYKTHNNGRCIQRLHSTTLEVKEEYGSMTLACIWIMRYVHNIINIESKDIRKKVYSLATSLSLKLKRRSQKNIPLIIGDFIWRFAPIDEQDIDEEWRDIPNLHPYQVSSFGRVRGKRCKILKGNVCSGYNDHKLGGNHLKTHRLVAQVFLLNPEQKPFVNHKDGNHLNNCVSNLEWVTNSENIRHAYDTGLNHKKKIAHVTKNGSLIATYDSATRAAYTLNLEQSAISAVCRGIQKQTKGFYFKFI
jgi:hypothetical protein